jgi:O-antigen/teichoic acid export membrane protein
MPGELAAARGASSASAIPAPAAPAPAPAPVPTLTRRATLNAVQALLDYAAKLGVGLVVTPILLDGLGRSLFGVWEMLGRLISYMSATDGRPTEALRLVIATQQATDDPRVHRRAVGSALVVWLLFLPLLTAVGAVLVWLAPIVTKVPPALHPTVRVVSAALVLTLLLGGLSSIPESVLRGMNLGYKRMGFQAGINVIGGLLTAGAIYAGFGLVGVAGAQVALTALTGVAFWLLAKQFVPWFGSARPSRGEVRALVGMSAWLAAGEVIAKLSLTSDVIILGMVVSSSVVTTYVLTGYAARVALGLHLFAVGAAMPGLGGVIGLGHWERAAHLRREILTLTWLFSTAVGTTMLLWNRSFLVLWVGEVNYAGPLVNLLIVLITAQTALLRSDSFVLDAMLRPRQRVVVGVLATVLIIGVSLALTPSLGIVGVCLGVLTGRLAQSIAYPVLVNARLRGPAQLALRPLGRPAAVMAVLFAGAAVLSERVLPGSWLSWLVGAGLTFGLSLGIAFWSGVPAATRHVVVERLRGIRGRPRA